MDTPDGAIAEGRVTDPPEGDTFCAIVFMLDTEQELWAEMKLSFVPEPDRADLVPGQLFWVFPDRIELRRLGPWTAEAVARCREEGARMAAEFAALGE